MFFFQIDFHFGHPIWTLQRWTFVGISFLCLFYQVILLSLPRTSSDNFPKIRGPENPRGLSHLHRMRTVEAQRGREMDEGEYCSQVLFD